MDLINKYKEGIKTSGATDATKEVEAKTKVPPIETGTKDNDLLAKTAKEVKTTAEDTKPKTKEIVTETKETSEVVEPDSWTKESAFKEIKRLREENKTYRVKYEEKLEGLKKEVDEKSKVRDEEVQNLLTAKKELEEIKSKEADNQRNLTEKLVHRESLLAETKAKLDTIDKEYKDALTKKDQELNKYKAEIEVQNELAKKRLDEELSTIPEKYKDMANLIVKGAGDAKDAFIAISEAKLKGLFEDKTVVVNHSVPGAKDGARATKERLESAEQEVRGKMTSSQKIAAALKQVRSGESNSAFRLNR
jgi:myosin heavy subunit